MLSDDRVWYDGRVEVGMCGLDVGTDDREGEVLEL